MSRNRGVRDVITERRHVVREMQAKLISHFLAVVEHRSISRAAEALHLTQPALSKSIKQLEDRLGVVLFERWPTGVRVTSYGEALARRARLIERELSHAVTELQSMKGGAKGVIKIGAGMVWTQVFLPPVVAKFQRALPEIQIELETGVIDTLVPRLTSGALDIVCTTLDFPDTSDIAKEPMIRIVHGIFARVGHPLAIESIVEPADLANWGWVTFKDDYVGHNRLGAFFAANGLGPLPVRMEMVPDLSILNYVSQSDYLCSLPIALEDTAMKHGVVKIDVANAALWSSNAGVAFRRTGHPVPAVEVLLTTLRESFAEDNRYGL